MFYQTAITEKRMEKNKEIEGEQDKLICLSKKALKLFQESTKAFTRKH